MEKLSIKTICCQGCIIMGSIYQRYVANNQNQTIESELSLPLPKTKPFAKLNERIYSPKIRKTKSNANPCVYSNDDKESMRDKF